MAGKRKKRKFDQINSIALLVIAVSALFISVWQGIENRNFNKLSLRPYLKYDFSNSADGLSVSIRNAGQGVAIVKGMQVLIDEKPYESWKTALKAISEDIEILNEAWIYDDQIVTPSEKLMLIKMTPIHFQGKELKIEITLESIYGESQTQLFTYSYGPERKEEHL